MRGFLAGLGIFLLGIKLMEETLMHGSIATLKRILKSYTNTMRKAVVSGTIVSTIAQSSTIVSVMTVAFVGAGVISLASGVGVIIGANIGSTVLGLVLGSAIGASLKLSAFALPMIAVGGIGELFLRKKKTIYIITKALFSLGLIFYGISLLNDVVSVYAYSIDLTQFGAWGILGYALIGVFLTALMHSSDAMLILALTFLAQGIIGFPEAIAIIIGANLGTTISAIEASVSGSAEQKQIALSHFLFNLISAIIALPLLYPSIHLLDRMFELPRQNVMALVIYDVIYNVAGALLFYPFLGYFVELLKRLVPQKGADFVLHSSHIVIGAHVEKAISSFTEDVMTLMKKVYVFNAKALAIDTKILQDHDSSLETKYGAVKKIDNENLEQEYNTISTIEESLMQFVVKIFQKHKDQASAYHTTLFILREAIERIVYSAKTLWDSKEILDELRDSRMSLIDEYLRQFTKEMIDFYVVIGAYLTASETDTQRKHLQKYFQELTTADEHFLNVISDTLPQEVLSNRQLAALLHLSQALNRSHKAMLHTVDLLFPEKAK